MKKPWNMVHNFQDSYEKAENEKNDPFWISVYEEAFPNMVNAMAARKYSDAQKAGIDRVILLSNTRSLYIDEKLRFREYPDILLEYISNDRHKTKGWMDKDLAIDYLAYAFVESKKCYLFDWQMLKRTWKYYRNIWIKEFGTVTAKNKGYNTLSVPVPTELLLSKVSKASIIQL